MRLILHVLGMFLLGAASLLAVGWLFHVRTSGDGLERSPAPLTVGTSGGSAAQGRVDTAADRVLESIRQDLENFTTALNRDRRAEAMAALDAARRATDVLHYATGAAPGMADLRRSVSMARRAVQNGNLGVAIDNAARARALVPGMSASVNSVPPNLVRYRGATVLAPNGEISGTVTSVAGDTVTIERGGVRDLLGFIDVRRGRTVRVAANQMIFGEPRRAGPTMVIAR